MADDEDIDCLARIAYESGRDPLDEAVWRVQLQIIAAGEVAQNRQRNPRLCPHYGDDPTPESVARRIVGSLIDAGWSLPAGAQSFEPR